MRLALAIAVLGALGSLARWLLALAVQRQVGGGFPAGTLVVNLIGSIAIGAVFGCFMVRGTESSSVRVAITTGFLGGFTTYSAFAFETVALFERRAVATAFVYLAATTILCLGGCALGLITARALSR